MTLDPRKYLIEDLFNKPTPMDVWLQGTIEQTVGTDILIISDTTGRAKITKCDAAHGVIDKSSIRKGWCERAAFFVSKFCWRSNNRLPEKTRKSNVVYV